ncbi:MAG: hypothetical protein GY943_36125 [Chloroflexi bacterium]|nr:hypothetical protein [Chloroflexota bacterium]
MTTQLQQAESICNDLRDVLGIPTVPAMSVDAAARLGYELNGRHIIAIVMTWDWKEAGRVVSAACPVSRRVLNMSKKDFDIRHEIIRACVGVWRNRVYDEWLDYDNG